MKARAVTVICGLVFSWLLWPAESGASDPDKIGRFKVGHVTFRIEGKDLKGSAGEDRPVDFEVWYPAQEQSHAEAPVTIYRSRLWGVPLIPSKWDPLRWQITSALAAEGAAIDAEGPAFPVVLFSHGAASSALDYLPTMEHLASHGYVVVAPWHTRNNQDDTRTNFVNNQAGFNLLPCLDGRPNPCMGQSPQAVIKNRVIDFNGALQALPALFGDRVDADRVGVMGHSAGALVAALAAGGSAPLAISPIQTVDAVMTLSFVSDLAAIEQTNLAGITVPTLVVASENDLAVPPDRSVRLYNGVASGQKAYVLLSNSVHRSFSTAFCSQMQAAGAVTQADEADEAPNPPRALLDRHTLTNMLIAGNNGSALEYCKFDSFTNPVDIRPIVFSMTGVQVTPSNVPSRGVSSDDVHRAVSELAVTFFKTALDANGNDGVHFTQYLAPKWLARHEPIIELAEAESDGKVCAGGLDVECAD